MRRRKVIDPPDGVRSDLAIVSELGRRLGPVEAFSAEESSAVFGELARATDGGVADYAGLDYARLSGGPSLHWPVPHREHPGTPRLFTDHRFAVPGGRARFSARPHHEPAACPDRYFPLYLTTGRVLAQYKTGNQTHRVAELEVLAGEPMAEVHPAMRARLCVADRAVVRVVSRRGSLLLRVWSTTDIRQDVVFVPLHRGGAKAANLLTNAALDPTSRMPEFKICAIRLEEVSIHELW